MTLEKRIAKFFKLDGENWIKHANPWSVWTRFVTLPFLVLAVWSRVWIDWYSLIPTFLIVIWIIVNPTLFKTPDDFNNWGSKSVLGEKYWSERKSTPVPKHHHIPVFILTILQIIGSAILVIGLWRFEVNITIIGIIVVYFSKMWFLDRMVWIFENMKSEGSYVDIEPKIPFVKSTTNDKTCQLDRSIQRRVKFDFEVYFSNGGNLKGEDFRLDINGETISDEELADYLVSDLRLLMVGEVKILNKEIVVEAHKRKTIN